MKENLAYIVILHFEKRRPKQKHCCSLKSNILAIPEILGCYRTVCCSNY